MSFRTNTSLETVLNLMPSVNGWILDAGGAMKPLTYATHVIDMLPYDKRSWYGVHGDPPERFSEETWMVRDLCDIPWPYCDKQFDFVWCTQTIEDLRDPISVIKEMSRVGKRGFITTIRRQYESILDVNSPDYAGYIHHRWLIESEEDKLRFLFKYPLVHISEEFRPGKCDDKFLEVWWEESIETYEKHLYSIEEIEQEFRDYAYYHGKRK